VHTVYLSTGSNLGNRENYLLRAEEAITEFVGHIDARSSVIETAPWGKTDQPNFLNRVLRVKTKMPPHFLMDTLLQIERDMGRNRHEKWGPRIIDLDILFFDNRIINEEGLCVPHPHLHERDFVLKPMVEIAPDFMHPTMEKTMVELLVELSHA
jgi:2-amino-4-hydroxy-6-hydroxymethyldihydropteridine diphosphokinase